MTNGRNRGVAAVLAGLVLLGAAGAGAADPAGKPPPNTNPADHVIYPAGGQDPDQQAKDQLESYEWATEQTRWDPYDAYDVLVDEGYAAAQSADQARGGAVSGAARGALAGLAIGAIAGDAGKGAAIGAAAGGLTGGARSRRRRMAAQDAADRAIQEFQSSFAVWDKHYVASMEGRGYSVK